MYAVIMTGGKQYQVNQGDVLFIEKLDAEIDTEVVFDQVLMLGKDKTQKFGTPTVKGATVTAKVLKNGKGKKLNIFTYKPKKGSKRALGHRQPYTKVEITGILEKAGKADADATSTEAVAEKKPAAKKTATATAEKKPAAKKTTAAAEKKPAAKKTTAATAEKKPAAKKPAAKKPAAKKATEETN